MRRLSAVLRPALRARCTKYLLTAVAVLAMFMPLQGQTAAGEETAFDKVRSKYEGKTLLLRNFYLAADLKYDVNGELIGRKRPGSWTLANIEISQLSLLPDGLEIVGSRMGTVFQQGKQSLVKVGDIRIHVGGAVQDKLEPLLARIFIAPGENLQSMVPECWKYFFMANDPGSRMTVYQSEMIRSGISADDLKYNRNVVPPPVVLFREPKAVNEALKAGVNGKTMLVMIVSSAGSARSVAILRPVGMGVDDAAAAAFQKWEFKPATLGGTRVPFLLTMEIESAH